MVGLSDGNPVSNYPVTTKNHLIGTKDAPIAGKSQEVFRNSLSGTKNQSSVIGGTKMCLTFSLYYLGNYKEF